MGLPPVNQAALLLQHNERVKLSASTLNTLALGLVGAGYVGPAFSVDMSIASRVIVLFLMALGALILHLVARGILGDLR